MSKRLLERRRGGRVDREARTAPHARRVYGGATGEPHVYPALDSTYDAAGALTPRAAIERRIALARLVLAFFCGLAVWLDPSEPERYAASARTLLAAYVASAAVVAAVAWMAPAPRGSPWFLHCVDVVVLSGVLAMIDRPLYPLLPLLVYAGLSGALRWQWRGTLATGAVLLAVSVGIAAYRAVSSAALFDVKYLVVRCAALAVITVLTGRLGALEARTRSQMRQLATPPESPSAGAEDVVGSMLGWAAAVVRAPRVLLVWGDRQEDSADVAMWDRGRYSRWREPLELLTDAVASEIDGSDFLHRPPSPCVLRSATGFRGWRGEPLDTAFRERFSIAAVCSLRLTGGQLSGRLFFLDKRGMTSDDLLLGGIIAHQLATRLRAMSLTRRLEDAVLLQERLRFARDLHDGAVQSLTGLSLELDRVLATNTPDPVELRECLRRVQLSLRDEQRQLRLLIQGLRTSDPAPWPTDTDLEARLRDLAARVERRWNVAVDVRTRESARIPAHRWADICLIVHEALVNASRHGRASRCTVEVGLDGADITILVVDNGCGFPFRGRYDHLTLSAQQAGPSTLMERTVLLGGTMTLDSSDHGATVDIRFPASQRSEA